jgi:sulfur carrier protein ThiS adenylyltransferase
MGSMHVFGLGGVGSHLAYLLTKLPKEHRYNPLNCAVSLVDFDAIEAKNLERQMFIRQEVGLKKCEALKNSLLLINPDFRFRAYDRKVKDRLDLANFSRDDLAVVCTDSVESKRLIAGYFSRFLIINCDEDYYEIKSRLDSEEQEAWQIREGYNSTQNFLSNMAAALAVYCLLLKGAEDAGVIRKRLTEKTFGGGGDGDKQ